MTKRLAVVLCAVACWCSWGVRAGDAEQAPPGEWLQQAPISDDELAGQRARGSGDGINFSEVNAQISSAEETARLDHNVVNRSTTGSNIVSHDAFSGASGFATVIQNSGNNVLIQNSTVLNYAVHP